VLIMKMDWKWIGIGAVIMLLLSFAASFISALFLRSELEGVTDVEQVSLSGGQMALIAILNFAAFFIGGFIVGVKSIGRTILEPGIAAAVAVAVVLLLAGSFSVLNIIAGGVVPFLAGVLGGWLGERRQVGPTRHAPT
jgi:hypothetical protein